MPIVLPSERGGIKLNEAEGEALFATYRAALSVTIGGAGVLSLPGSGRYKLLPASGITGAVVSITLTGENVEGTLMQLRPETTGHTITLVHGSTLRLPGGYNAELTTVFSSIWIRHHGSGVFVADSAVLYVP